MVQDGRPASGLQAFWDLERYLASASQSQLRLPDIERESERRGPDDPLRLANKKLHRRRMDTIFGEVTVTRVGYGAPGQTSIHPLDAELALPARAYSYELCRRLIRAAVCGPFDEAITVVAEMTGVTLPKRSAEQLVVEAAADFDDFYATRAQQRADLADGEILIGAIDGKGIPMVKPNGAVKVVRRGKGEKANRRRWPPWAPCSAGHRGCAAPRR